MSRLRYICCVLSVFAVTTVTAYAQTANSNDVWTEINKLNWQLNGAGQIGDQATIQVPNGYAFLGASDTRQFLVLNGNLPEDNNYTIGPKSLKWFGEFRFDDSGYVTDNEKLDPQLTARNPKKSQHRTTSRNEATRSRTSYPCGLVCRATL